MAAATVCSSVVVAQCRASSSGRRTVAFAPLHNARSSEYCDSRGARTLSHA